MPTQKSTKKSTPGRARITPKKSTRVSAVSRKTAKPKAIKPKTPRAISAKRSALLLKKWHFYAALPVVLSVGFMGVYEAVNIIHSQLSSAVTVPTVKDPLSFIDTFNNNRLDGWKVVDEGTTAPSKWVVVNNHVEQHSNIWGGTKAANDISKAGTELIAGNLSWKDYDFTTTVVPKDNDDVGIVFRYQDSDNYYRFSMDKERNYWRLVKKVQGYYTTLAQSSKGYTIHATYTLRALVEGASIRVFVNGTQAFRVADSSLTSGQIGLYTWGEQNSSFDNVSVKVAQQPYFTMAVVPDTQYESSGSPQMGVAQMKWLSANRASLNLGLVMQEGDVVDKLNIPAQWKNAHNFLSYLDGKVHYVIAPGNHDMFTPTADSRPYPIHPANFNALMASFKDYEVAGFYKSGDYLNTYHLADIDGIGFLVMDLQFGPTNDQLTWAGKIADKYPTRHVILLTHDYLSEKSTLRGATPGEKWLPSQINKIYNNGNQIWAKFVKTHKNVQFTFNGHVIAPTDPGVPVSVGRLLSKDDAGNSVFQMLANYQSDKSGQGYLRLLRFYPGLNKVEVTTYSPYLNSYLTDSKNQFTLTGVNLGSITQ